MKGKIDVNPYLGAKTICDRCGDIIVIESTFLMCNKCRLKYIHQIKKLWEKVERKAKR